MEYFNFVRDQLRRSKQQLAAVTLSLPRQSKVLALELPPDGGRGGGGEPQQ
jgi:hypothetical protein